MMIEMILQFIFCTVATIAFSIIFSAPVKELIFCGISGTIGWIVYLLVGKADGGVFLACVMGTLMLTLFSRITSAIRRKPVTVYLITGIFPLVPGAGIYYTSYNLIMNNMDEFTSNGIFTLKTAGGIVIGILIGMALPQSIFNKIGKICHSKN